MTVMHLMCGWTFRAGSVANFSWNVAVKEFLKIVHIWRRCGQEFGLLFFVFEVISVKDVLCAVAVQGCRKFVAPAGSSVTEEGNTATVRCNGSRETWYFTCTDTRWRGRIVNCTNKGLPPNCEKFVRFILRKCYEKSRQNS